MIIIIIIITIIIITITNIIVIIIIIIIISFIVVIVITIVSIIIIGAPKQVWRQEPAQSRDDSVRILGSAFMLSRAIRKARTWQVGGFDPSFFLCVLRPRTAGGPRKS